DFQGHFIDTEVEFAPGPAFPDTVLADFPLAFTVNFDAGRVYNQMVRLPRFLSEALYSLQLRMRYVCFFMAEKAYQVTASATLHSVSCNKAQIRLQNCYDQGRKVVKAKNLGELGRSINCYVTC